MESQRPVSPLPDALLRVPHSGYHWPGGLFQRRDRRFFEGWYYRVTLPERGASFAFMYSIEDPQGGALTSGGFVQVLGPGDGRAYALLKDVSGFWAATDRLALGYQQQGHGGYVDPEHFEGRGEVGYQATDTLNQGRITDEVTGETVRWHYRIRPVYGWGRPDRAQATMGLLSYLSVFEPGWQILMSHGLAEGWIEWRGERYLFRDAPAYGEKNWGGAFPDKWFWVQANAFPGNDGAALVTGGGVRGVLWWRESVAMVSLYACGQFYRFMTGEAEIHCAIEPWGRWQIEGVSEQYRIEVLGTVPPEEGIELLAPTLEGARFVCRDTLVGEVSVRLRRRWGDQRVLFESRTALGGLETGGGPWPGSWTFTG